MSVAGATALGQNSKLDSIQVLRGLAALFIVLFHAFQEISVLYPDSLLSNINSKGFIYGIDLFFVISGFIMMYASSQVFNFNEAKKFIVKRVIRIVPLYWFFITLLIAAYFTLPAQLSYLDFSFANIIKTYLFIPYFDIDGQLFPFYKVGWTLNYEMYFYALFALMMLIPKRFFMIAISAAILIPVLFNIASPSNGSAIQQFLGFQIILNFLSGIWIGFLFKKGFRLPKGAQYLGVLVIALSIVWMIFEAQINQLVSFEFPKKTFAALSIALVVLPHAIEGLKFPRFMLFIGDSSYSLYLAHSFAIGLLVVFVGYVTLPVWLFFFLCVFLSIIAGSAAYLLIEKPVLSASKRLILRPNKE